MENRPLIELPLQTAQILKYERGRRLYRPNGGEFVGDPMVELFEECLDAIHYCDELLKRGYVIARNMRAEFELAALQLQRSYRERKRV